MLEIRHRAMHRLDFRLNILSLKFFQIFLLQFLPFPPLTVVSAIRCYCTDEHCVPYGVCEADVCVVGLTKDDAVIRTCGDEPLGCRQNVGNWRDICACGDSFCNTYSYLRTSYRERERTPISDDDLVFHRMDRPDDFTSDFDDSSQYNPSLTSKTSLLTLLLVIVPLSVGAATVLVVSFNYYCHLC